MSIKIEEGKYYRTRDGRKVGPARKINDDDFTWARWRSGSEILEIVGVYREDAFDTELVSEWTDDTPKLWRDMTDEEKGALLLAQHEGGSLQRYCEFRKEWVDASLHCGPQYSYRVKPEPVRKTVEFFSDRPKDYWLTDKDYVDTHRITFDTIDGEPDCASIKMEKL